MSSSLRFCSFVYSLMDAYSERELPGWLTSPLARYGDCMQVVLGLHLTAED